MSDTHAWLDPVFAGPRPALVLCRHPSTAREVLRQIAHRGGRLGVLVATPATLAHTLAPNAGRHCPPAPLALPEHHPWRTAHLESRPQLAAALQHHLTRAWLERQAQPTLTFHPHLDALLDIPTLADALTDTPRALAELGVAAHAHGPRLHPEHTFAAIYAIGFGAHTDLPAPPGPRRFLARLLTDLDARSLAATTLTTSPTARCITTHDVLGEARLVARLAHQARHGAHTEPDDILVLYAADTDAARIQAALERLELPVAHDARQSLGELAIATLARALCRWLQSPDPVLTATELVDVCAHPSVRGSLGATPDGTPVGLPTAPATRTLRQLLGHLALHRARLMGWREVLDEAPRLPARLRPTARLLHDQLGWIAGCRDSAPPSLGTLRRTLTGLLDPATLPGDTQLVALLDALDAHAERPLTHDVLDRTLQRAASRAPLRRGVRLLPWTHYDGRPARLLIATGLHHRGFGAAATPDPFLDATTLETLGHCPGAARVELHRAQLLAAARRAHEVVACMTRHDATGRPLVGVDTLPIDLRRDDRDIDPTHLGLEHRIGRERQARDALRVRHHEPVAELHGSPGPAPADHAAAMATAEWVRAGACGPTSPDTLDDDHVLTVVDYVAAHIPAIPAWLSPWLGDARDVPGARLPPDQPLSATRAAEPLGRCLYQAFGTLRLDLRPLERVRTSPDLRDLGRAIHRALERLEADHNDAWRAPPEHLDARRQALLDALHQTTDEAWQHLFDRPGRSPAQATAELAARERWKRHWAAWVDARLVDTSQAAAHARTLADHKLARLPAADAIVALVDPERRLHPASVGAVRRWIARAVRTHIAGQPLHDVDLPSGRTGALVERLLHRPQLGELLAHLARQADTLDSACDALFGPVHDGLAEWWLREPGGGNLELDLHGHPVVLQGRLDRLRIVGPRAELAELVDYKTGRSAATTRAGLASGTHPQLLFLALALERLLDDGRWPLATTPTAPRPWVLAHDFVRDPDGGLQWWLPGLEGMATHHYGLLLAETLAETRSGHYPVLPHRDACPHLVERGAWCDLADACRFRTWPGARLGLGDHDDDREEADP